MTAPWLYCQPCRWRSPVKSTFSSNLRALFSLSVAALAVASITSCAVSPEPLARADASSDVGLSGKIAAYNAGLDPTKRVDVWASPERKLSAFPFGTFPGSATRVPRPRPWSTVGSF